MPRPGTGESWVAPAFTDCRDPHAAPPLHVGCQAQAPRLGPGRRGRGTEGGAMRRPARTEMVTCAGYVLSPGERKALKIALKAGVPAAGGSWSWTLLVCWGGEPGTGAGVGAGAGAGGTRALRPGAQVPRVTLAAGDASAPGRLGSLGPAAARKALLSFSLLLLSPPAQAEQVADSPRAGWSSSLGSRRGAPRPES